jgi:hypothetical protein
MISQLFISCTSDDSNPAPLGSYDNGVLVLNEGGFGEITYLSNDLQTVQNDVFAAVNGETENLGTYAQSMFFNGDRAYIISNGSNKITVVNRYSMEYIATIATGMQIPRYGVVYNGKAYITNMNDYASSTDDFVTVINLADFTVETPIAIHNIAERLVAYDGRLYVSGGAFGMGDTITVVDIQSKTIEDTITVGVSPNSLEEKNGTLYVLCGSFSAESKLVKINLATNAIIDTVPFPATMGNAQNLDIEGNSVYFSVGPKVYKNDVNLDAVIDEPLFAAPSTSAYIGYGFGVNADRIFLTEAAEDFTSFGKVFVYSINGTYLDDLQTGLGPNGVYFN